MFKSDKIDPYWNNRFIWYADIAAARPADGEIMIGAQRSAIDAMKEFYQINAPLYADLLQLVKWEAGMSMRPHADNANPDGSTHQMAHRDLSGIVYLNDDYEGGELYFTALDIAIKPKRGMFVGMTAGFHHEHGVLRVTSGTRLTMPFFLTLSPEYADSRLIG
jgi:predicted 2-oxoglutarate/Fe(II)-dependent dioxygenase YbiX